MMQMGNTSRFRLLLLMVVSSLVAACGQSGNDSTDEGNDFPDPGKAISFIVPYSTGGPGDTQARFTAKQLEEELGTRVQVVNREGGNTVIGLTQLAQAEPDGYTFGMIAFPNALAWVWPGVEAPYGKEDFVPLASIADTTDVLVVSSKSPYESLEDLIEAAKEDPGGIMAAAEGVQSTDMLTITTLEHEAGIDLDTALYPDGGPQKVAALLGGQIDVATMTEATAKPQVESGEFRLLAMLSEEPLEGYEDIPTATSLGYNVVAQSQYTLALPAGTPDDVRETLENAMLAVGETEEFKKNVTNLGIRPNVRTGQEVVDLMDQVEEATTAALERLE